MQSPDLRSLVRQSVSSLAGRCEVDPYLLGISGRFPSHRFLGNCASAVYVRQVGFLASLLTAYFGRATSEIRILDWGCGKGHITYLLRKHGFYVISSDRATSQFDSAFGQETPILAENGISVVPLEDPVALPFPDSSFDCVTSFGVLEHVSSDLGSLREIRRVIRDGGLLYVSFLPYHLSWTQNLARILGDSYHDRLYSIRGMRELAAAARFDVTANWLAQLFPKNSLPLRFDPFLEPLDRALCKYTPLRYLATNLELVLHAI